MKPRKGTSLADFCVLSYYACKSIQLYVIVHPSVISLSSVTFVRPTQAIEIFRNVSTPFGTLVTHDSSIKILQSWGNPSVGGVKHKKGS